MLSAEAYDSIQDSLVMALKDRSKDIINLLYDSNRLNEFLNLVGLSYLLEPENGYQTFKRGKILIIGGSCVKEKDVMRAVKASGIDKKRIELCLDYKKAKNYDFHHIQYNTSYSLILAGPMPHSGVGKGEYSSKLTAVEAEEGYPPVIRLGSSGLKITKSEIEKKIQYCLDQGYIAI